MVVAGFAGLKEGTKVKAVEAPSAPAPTSTPAAAETNTTAPAAPAPSTPPAAK